MQKIFRVLMLMLVTALVACGGGGGSPGGNPNQPTLVTTAGSEVILPVGAARSYQISGGIPPYRVGNTDQAIAIGQITDNTLTIGTVSAGATKINVLDNSGATISIDVKVGSSIPLYTTAPSSLTIGVGSSVARTFWVGGGGAPYTVEGGDSNVALVQVIGDTQWRVTGVAIGSTTIKIRDAAGEEISISLEVGSPELRMTPDKLTMPVGLEAVAKISGGQPPYRVAGGIPAAITATIVGDELRIKGNLASKLDVTVADSAGKTVKIEVEINTATTSIRLSPSAVAISESDTQPIQFGIFGAVGATCVFTSDPSFLLPTVPGCATRSSVTLNTGTRGSRCVNGSQVIALTVVDENKSVGNAEITIVDNGSCGNLTLLPATAQVRVGATMQLAIAGGSGQYIVSSDNPAVATATASGVVMIVTAGNRTGSATITLRDQSDTSKVVTLPVTVVADTTPSVPAVTTSPQTLNLLPGASADVLLSGGSGKFDVAVSNTQIATATLSGNVLRVTAQSLPGTATVTIRDQVDPTRSATVSVTVGSGAASAITASPQSLNLGSGASADVLLSGGSGKFDYAVSNSVVATAVLAGNKLTVTAGANTGSATVTVRDQTDPTRTAVIPVTVTAGPAPIKPMTASPSAATGSVSETLHFLLQNGTAPYNVVVSNPSIATVTLPVVGNLINVELKQAGQTTLVVTDANGQTLNIQVTANQTQQASLRFAPSAFEIGEDSVLPVTLTVFGGTGPYRALTSDMTLSSVAVNTDPVTKLTEFTVGLGTRTNRCINPVKPGTTTTVIDPVTGASTVVTTGDEYIPRGSFDVILTVVDSGGAFATSTMTIRDNGSGMPGNCPAATGFTTTAGSVTSVLLGSSRTYSIYGGTQPYKVESSNPAVAAVALSSQNGFSITGKAAGSATVTIRDAASGTVTITVNVNP